MAGSGKTTVKEELIHRGYIAYDTDENGLTLWINKRSGQPAEAKPNIQYGTSRWYETYLWTLQTDKVREKAKQTSGKLVFMCGIPGNWRDVMPIFDRVYCLALGNEPLKQRLLHRANNNYGKASHELRDILGWNKSMAADSEKLGATVIDADRPVEEIIDMILKSLGQEPLPSQLAK